ncbi:MAG: hypothetical protein JOZ57_13595, partial [Abitibacteriaceae bacterium]|nr:hypothetical protein [Abditibacteriaceae bacterium]
MEQTLSDSPHNPISSPSDHDYPVVIEIQQAEKTAQGLFRPQASLKVTAVLRTSGLLLALPGEEVKNLLFLLTFLTPNGDCLPTVQQLAQAMHVSAAKAQARMQRLMQFRWQGEPLVIWLRRESGLHAYTPNPRLIAYEHLEL